MLKLTRFIGLLAATLVTAMWAMPAQAQATRTWVSGTGSDLNPCSRTAPCKTFAGAYPNTAAGGEIDVLDPGGYGGLTISKSLTIDGGAGQVASILTSGSNGITVAGSGVVVTLKNLSINGLGASSIGISFTTGAQLNVVNCDIFGYTTYGIGFVPSNAGAKLYVADTNIHNGAAYAMVLAPPAGTPATATLDNVKMYENGIGLRAMDNMRVTATRSDFSSNLSDGIEAASSSSAVIVDVEESNIANNGGSGLATYGTVQPIIYISNNFISGNLVSMSNVPAGTIISFGNNRIMANGTNNGPTTSNLQQ